MRKLLLAGLLALLAPCVALAQVSGGTATDAQENGTLDLSTVGATVAMPIGNGQGVVAADVTGLTGSGATVVVERTVGGSWSPRNLLVVGSAGAFTSALTADTSLTLNSVGSRAIRFRVTVAGTGQARIFTNATVNSSLIQMATSLPPGANNIGDVDILSLPPVALAPGAAVSATQAGAWSFNLASSVPLQISNFPTSFAVSNFPATQAVSGTVSVGNFPATQPVSIAGTVQVADANGSLTVDAPQLPASVGAKAGAASLSVVPSTDATFPVLDRGTVAMATGQVAVGTSAVLVVPARAGRRVVVLIPTSNTIYYVGNAGVTSSTGAILGAGAVVTMPTTSAIYAVAAGNMTISYMEFF